MNEDFVAEVLGLAHYDLAGVLAYSGEGKKALESLEHLGNLEICPGY